MIKKLKLATAMLLLYAGSYATVHTVNNVSGGQFTDINSAVNAASPGDTIYIWGSATDYTPPGTRKANITFIGTGYNVQKQNPLKSTVPVLHAQPTFTI